MGEVNEVFILVRARVNTPDHEGAQDLLLSMMDPSATTSVSKAINSNRTLGGVVEHVHAEPPPTTAPTRTREGRAPCWGRRGGRG